MRVLVHNQMTRLVDDEVQALFPAEQARVAELFAAGALEQLYIAADYGQAWLIARGEALDDVEALVSSLPLARFVRSSFTPLADLP